MLTADEAYAKHIEMWKAMQEALGDNPPFIDRWEFKRSWCEERGETVDCYCYLCQYNKEQFGGILSGDCGKRCLVDWGTVHYGDLKLNGCCYGKTQYESSPISEILALPRREVSE